MATHTTITTVDGEDYLVIEDPDTGAVIEGHAVEVRP
jgi:hypothetical protein